MESPEKSILKFNNQEEISQSIDLIKKEYSQKVRKRLFYIFGILAYVIIFIFIADALMLLYNDINGFGIQYLNLSLALFWTIYSTCIYSVFYLLKILYIKETPLLIQYLKKEINRLDLKIKRSRLSEISFILFTSISLILLLLIDLRIIKVHYTVIDLSFQITLVLFLIMNLTIPIILGLFFDRYKIQLKKDYYIRLDIQHSLEKQRSQTLSVYMTSNILSSKLNPMGLHLHKKIAQYRWLPKKNGRLLTKTKLTPFLRFFEYSTPANFKYNFLNLAMALRDWQEKYIDENLVFYQDLKVRKRKLEYCQHRTVNNVCYILKT
ncbi:MAG: membrane protein of unknown function [Promethearchaeota archaeon]|nr:MAG: membrane protein of unknown function [Candidatus Lokiarchaeota archaeon]